MSAEMFHPDVPETNPVAVIGFGCLLPKAGDRHAYWDLIRTGGSAVTPIPEELFERKLLFDPKKGVQNRSYTDLAALVDYTTVDADRIAESLPFLTASQLKRYDPAHIAYAKTLVEAVEMSRSVPSKLRETPTGVYIGHSTPSGLGAQYSYGVQVPNIAELFRELPALRESGADVDRLVETLVRDVRERSPKRTRSNNPPLGSASAAMMTSQAYRLDGPAMVFNSSCASSLQAFAHAVMAIRRGKIEAAVVGGASCFHANTLILFSLAHTLSAADTAPFEERADGLILGEGYVTVLLKRLDAALRDGNPVLALVGGIGISSDGKGKSLWAPRTEGQAECIRRAYPDPKILDGLQYVECHATSTHLGDAIEMESLTTVLRESGLEKFRGKAVLPVGSVKRNIGHTLECSGLTGIAKVLLALRHETIPAAVPAGVVLNKNVNWDDIPVFPPTAPISWPKEASVPRRAGVESFGIGGLNVHVTLEDYCAESPNTVGRKVLRPAKAAPRENTETAIAVIGTGLILPGAKSVEEFRRCLASGEEIRRPVPESRWNSRFYTPDKAPGWEIPDPVAAVVEDYHYDWKRHKVPPKQLAQASPLQFMFLDAVDQALQNAGYIDAAGKELKPLPRKRLGCIVGTSFGGDFGAQLALDMQIPYIQRFLREQLGSRGVDPVTVEEVERQFAKRAHERFPALVDETGSFTASSLASRITKSYDLMGGGIAVDAEFASTGAAIECCTDMLRAGTADMMLCLCGEQDLTPERFVAHDLFDEREHPVSVTTALGRKKAGIVPGEGCVVFLLKRLEDAQRDGDSILGILRADCFANQSPNSADKVIVEARESLPPQTAPGAVEIVYTGSPESEKNAVETVRRHYPEAVVDSRIAQFGQLRNAAGAVALLTSLEALAGEQVPAASGKTGARPSPLQTTDPQGRLYMAVHVAGNDQYVQHFILQRGTPVTPIAKTQTSGFSADSYSSSSVHFDATERRRERLRAQSTGKSIPATPAAVPVPTPVQAPTPAPAPEPVKRFDPAELEAFLVNFVVDQTGYPAEIVDLDVDLEADLGIDSIKKAQLFGEIGQYFSVQTSDDLTLDQFPTLRSVMAFLLEQGAPSQSAAKPVAPTVAPAPVAAVPTAPVEAPTVAANPKLDPAELESFLVTFVVDQTGYPAEIVDLDVDLEADLGIDSIKKAQLFGEIGQYFSVQTSDDLTLDQFPTLRSVMAFLLEQGTENATPPAPSSPAPPTELASPASTGPSLDPDELEAFLVNFVVDQTGYPAEIVDLDVDLEADLGIDSIKKAQLFGEIGQYFSVQTSDDLTLDQFPTLRSVMDFLIHSKS